MQFSYYNPQTEHELISRMNDLENYALLAGGTDLLVKMKERVLRPMPKAIIDLNAINSLRLIADKEGYLWIGSLATHSELIHSPLVNEKAYVLAEAAVQVGSPQIRNRGTVGGNICNASPAADTVPALLALDTKVVIRSQDSKQEAPLTEVFEAPGRTCLLPGQYISALKLRPIGQNEGAAFLKFGKRKALAVAVINGAAWIKIENSIIIDVRIALGSVAPTAIRLYEVEKWLIGKPVKDTIFAKAGAMAAGSIKPIDDIRSMAIHRTRLANSIVARCLEMAAQRARGVGKCE